MKRLLWLGVGLAVGALVVRAVSKKANSYTPQGIAAAVRGTGQNAFDSIREFVDDVRDGMHEREYALQAALAEGQALDEEAFLGDDVDLGVPDRDPTEDSLR